MNFNPDGDYVPGDIKNGGELAFYPTLAAAGSMVVHSGCLVKGVHR
jgi:hypothetical protein